MPIHPHELPPQASLDGRFHTEDRRADDRMSKVPKWLAASEQGNVEAPTAEFAQSATLAEVGGNALLGSGVELGDGRGPTEPNPGKPTEMPENPYWTQPKPTSRLRVNMGNPTGLHT